MSATDSIACRASSLLTIMLDGETGWGQVAGTCGRPLHGDMNVKNFYLMGLSSSWNRNRRSEGSSPSGRGTSRHNLAFGAPEKECYHDACMRIGGEAPGWRAHSQSRLKAMGRRGSPPPRIVFDGPSAQADGCRIYKFPTSTMLAAGLPPVVCHR